MVKSMLEIFMSLLWSCFAVYAIWYLTSAKHYAPISFAEARMLWKIHKLNIKCNARKWREIRRGGKTVGFECECGYKHIQKRPIVANMPAPNVQPQISMFDKLHTPYKST